MLWTAFLLLLTNGMGCIERWIVSLPNVECLPCSCLYSWEENSLLLSAELKEVLSEL